MHALVAVIASVYSSHSDIKTSFRFFYVHATVHRNKFLINKTN
jgi:hypothetical protein